MEDFMEKRSEPRIPVSYEVRFFAVDTERNSSKDPRALATLVNTSSRGFGMVIPFQLERGRVVIIESKGYEDIPHFGVVMWSRAINDKYRIGCIRPHYYE
jgi:hypothetical protein